MAKKGAVKKEFSIKKDIYELACDIAHKKGTSINKVIKEGLYDFVLANKQILTETKETATKAEETKEN